MKTLRGRRRGDEQSDHGVSPPMTALIVDDEASYRTYVTSLAERVGFVADAAADGNGALAMLANAPYDLLLVNLETPGVNSLEMIAHVRGEDALKGMYTVLITSRDDAEEKISALAAGYDDFLSKSSTELEITAKLVAARRLIVRQQTFDQVVHDLYGLASRDELTGVFNRRFLMAEIENLLRQGGPVTLVLFDLDNFKRINDTFGHLVGDRVLRDIGALFQRRTRPEDLVGRYGGDEFILVVTGSPFYLVETVAERLVGDIRNLEWTVGDDQFSIGASTGFGSSHFLKDATLPQILDAADRDLYKNKWHRTHPENALAGNDRALPLPQTVPEIAPAPTPKSKKRSAGTDLRREA